MSDGLSSRGGTLLADRYRLGSLIGEGGSGFVYEAEQVPLGRTVAVKLLRAGEIDIERFGAEARTASRIDHPNAVAIYDFGVSQHGVPYLAMERVHGRTLAQLLDQGPLPVARAGDIARQVLAAMEEAHQCDVVHCDLKSENVVVDDRRGRDRVKVIDFGLARLGVSNQRETTIAGTPGYMAPEQITGEGIGPACDIYAVGVLLYEMLVGRTPFAGGSLTSVLDRTLSQAPIAPRDLAPNCPRALSDLIMRALGKDPRARPTGAAAMIVDLVAALGCPHCSAPRARSARFCVECGATLDDLTAPGERVVGRLGFPGGAQMSSANTIANLELEACRWAVVGRDELIDRVVEAVTPDDGPGVLVLVGPRGAGKARVLTEAIRRLGTKAHAAVARPDPSGQHDAWYPVIELLSTELGLPPRMTDTDLQRAATALGLHPRDLPGLAELFRVPGPLDGLELAVRRRETVAAARHAVAGLAAMRRGTVLCFTDVEDYDAPTLDLLAALAMDEHADTRIVVTTTTSAVLPPGLPTLEVAPLDRDQSATLASVIAIGSVRELPCPDDLHRITGGLPGAIEQLVGWLAEGGSVGDAVGIADLISARVNTLSAEERRALQAIAVFGEVAPDAAVRSVLGKLGGGGRGLERLCLRGLAARAGDAWVIPSPLIAQVALASAPSSVRRRLHQCALDVLKREHAAASARRIGHHTDATDDRAASYRALLAAGEDAVNRFDDVGASQCFSRAVACARAMVVAGEPTAPRRVVRASMRLADTLRFTGDTALAAGVIQEAGDFATELADRAEVLRVRGRVATARQLYSVACELFREAIGLGLRVGDRRFLCAAYVDLAGVLVDRGDPRAAVDELSEAIEVVTLWEGLSVRHAVPSLWLLGYRLACLQLAAGDVTGAERTAHGALRQTSLESAPQARARVHALLADIAAHNGDRSAERTHRARAIDDLQRVGDRRSTAELLLANARAADGDDADDDAEALALARQLAAELGAADLLAEAG